MPKSSELTDVEGQSVIQYIQVVEDEDDAHYVRVPIEDYRRQQEELEMARIALARLEDPKTQFVAVEQVVSETIGVRIAAARKNKGIPQVELARRMEISQSEVSRIETSPDSSMIARMRRIAQELGVGIHDLI